MNEHTSVLSIEVSFKDFLIKNRRNRIILWTVAGAILIQFLIFKYFYPYPNFIHDDSFVYLDTALNNLDINSHLVGYSRFLRLISVFTNSDTVLVAIQFLLLQTSVLYFLFTIFYFYKPEKTVQIILLSFMVLNPLFLYMSNMVSSDCFFLALSFIWFSLLLWIMHRATNSILIWHALVLFIAFTVRYNAIIYPLISLLGFWFSKLTIRKKIIYYLSPVLLIGLFILYNGNRFQELTGKWQYSPFSGWQLANNAMYAYRYVDSVDRKPVPPRLQALDNSIRAYFDSTRNTVKFPLELLQASTFYMWRRDLPLYKFRDKQFYKDTASSDFKKWAAMGPLYKDYGLNIIEKHPGYFAKYFLLPNALKYYAPPVEYLETYNNGGTNIRPEAQEWFDYRQPKVSTRLKSFKINLLSFYPILSGVMNGLFLFCMLCFILLKGFRTNNTFPKMINVTFVFWILNAVFSIFSTAAALRFLSFPIMLMSVFTILLIDWMLSIAMNMETERINIGIDNSKNKIPTEAMLWKD